MQSAPRAGNDSVITEMTAASWRPALAQCAADNKQAQLLNLTCHAFVGDPATHSSTYKLITIRQMFSQHRKVIVRNTITDFKPTSIIKIYNC